MKMCEYYCIPLSLQLKWGGVLQHTNIYPWARAYTHIHTHTHTHTYIHTHTVFTPPLTSACYSAPQTLYFFPLLLIFFPLFIKLPSIYQLINPSVLRSIFVTPPSSTQPLVTPSSCHYPPPLLHSFIPASIVARSPFTPSC